MTIAFPERRCPRCGEMNKVEARFCASCGRALADVPVAASVSTKRTPPATVVVLGGALVLIAAAFLAAWFEQRSTTRSNERAISTLRAQVADLERTVDDLNSKLDDLGERVGLTEQRTQGAGPLVARVLPSVFSIETPDGAAAGFAAWRDESGTVLLTAAHVVSGWAEVTVRRKERSWTGQVLERDQTNDLATVRVGKEIGRPLWLEPTRTLPKAGATLVLFGSPLGLEGTVTRGIVSRVAYNEIQTDAPANPGSSGGPALTEDGRVVGLVTSGFEGRDINFVVPIRRVCVKLRAC